MHVLRNLRLGFAYRRVLRTLSVIDSRLAEQNTYLRRLADHFAPEPPANQGEPVHSVDFLAPAEAAIVDQYVQRTHQDTGRVPTEEEILRYLADESTIDLKARLEQEV